MTEITPQKVTDLVRAELSGQHPSGLTLEVLAEQVKKIDSWWQVPIHLISGQIELLISLRPWLKSRRY